MNTLKLVAILLVGTLLVWFFTYGAMKATQDLTRTIEMGLSNMYQHVE